MNLEFSALVLSAHGACGAVNRARAAQGNDFGRVFPNPPDPVSFLRPQEGSHEAKASPTPVLRLPTHRPNRHPGVCRGGP